MLQQTRVEVVRDYFSRWMEKFPSVTALSAASEADVLRLWQGLGYYSRAKRLLSGAKYVTRAHAGELPRTVEQLLKVPGIGPYSAGAIASIAYQERAPLVDGNVIRVLTRLFALGGAPNKAPLKLELWRVADQLVCPDRPGDFNQALMELGALVCTPKNPGCLCCPLRKDCRALSRGEVHRFPELPKRPAPTALSMTLVILENQNQVALQKVPDDARWWAGLDSFPFAALGDHEVPRSAAEALAELHGRRVGAARPLPLVKHSVTRFRIQLYPYVQAIRLRKEGSGLHWIAPERAFSLALPAPHMRALKALVSS